MIFSTFLPLQLAFRLVQSGIINHQPARSLFYDLIALIYFISSPSINNASNLIMFSKRKTSKRERFIGDNRYYHNVEEFRKITCRNRHLFGNRQILLSPPSFIDNNINSPPFCELENGPNDPLKLVASCGGKST